MKIKKLRKNQLIELKNYFFRLLKMQNNFKLNKNISKQLIAKVIKRKAALIMSDINII